MGQLKSIIILVLTVDVLLAINTQKQKVRTLLFFVKKNILTVNVCRNLIYSFKRYKYK